MCYPAKASGLRELDLSLNLLTKVPRDLSLFAPRLEILDLSCNEISSANLDSSFVAMHSLRQLDLSRNRIHFLAADDFRPLAGLGLEVLNLGECELAVVDESALDPLAASLTSLSLAGNPLGATQIEQFVKRFGVSSTTPEADGSASMETTGRRNVVFPKPGEIQSVVFISPPTPGGNVSNNHLDVVTTSYNGSLFLNESAAGNNDTTTTSTMASNEDFTKTVSIATVEVNEHLVRYGALIANVVLCAGVW